MSDRRVLEVNFAPSRSDSAAPASVAERAAQLVAACEQFKMRRVHLLAHGFGALTALALLQSSQVAHLCSARRVAPRPAIRVRLSTRTHSLPRRSKLHRSP